MLYEAIFIAIIAGWLARGKIANLVGIRLSQSWMVFLAFFLKIGMDLLWSQGFKAVYDFRVLIHGISYLLLFIFLWKNRKLPGSSLLALGFFLNFVVIMTNGGAMPSTINGLDQEYVRLLQENGSVAYRVINNQTILPWLADIMIQPWPKAKAFSVGDIFISLGIFWLVFKSMTNHKLPSKLVSLRGIKL